MNTLYKITKKKQNASKNYHYNIIKHTIGQTNTKKTYEALYTTLRRKLKHLKITLNEKTVNELVNYFKLKTSLDLFYRVGIGTIDVNAILSYGGLNDWIKIFYKGKEAGEVYCEISVASDSKAAFTTSYAPAMPSYSTSYAPTYAPSAPTYAPTAPPSAPSNAPT